MNGLIIKPSQWMNLGAIILGVAGAFIFPPILLLPVIKILETYYWQFIFNERGIIVRKGILNVERNEILFHRIKSIRIEEPFLYRLVGIANLYVTTSDQYVKEYKFPAIPSALPLYEALRDRIENKRRSEKTRELDIYHM